MPQTYKRITPQRDVDVISIPALRNPLVIDDQYGHESDKEEMRRRIRCLLQIAKDNGVECLVLSAFGCGAFRNPAREVALLFKEELPQFQFSKIIFGIKDDTLQNRSTTNYSIFNNVFL